MSDLFDVPSRCLRTIARAFGTNTSILRHEGQRTQSHLRHFPSKCQMFSVKYPGIRI